MIDKNQNLAELISVNAGKNPEVIAEAIWSAGYRKSPRNVEDLVTLSLTLIHKFQNARLPVDVWPRTCEDILRGELIDHVIDTVFAPGASAVNSATELAAAGYKQALGKTGGRNE
ncbi:hypothetical protein [Mixta calida]|uniref:hypothetical protein n=1 Tax=Mixta calida TaxID=665913 RepID=UPI0034D3B944